VDHYHHHHHSHHHHYLAGRLTARVVSSQYFGITACNYTDVQYIDVCIKDNL
jgi:hypothetical protein